METDAIKTLLGLGTQGLLLWLYLRSDARLQVLEGIINQLQEKRVEEAKSYIRLQTDLEGTESRVKA